MTLSKGCSKVVAPLMNNVGTSPDWRVGVVLDDDAQSAEWDEFRRPCPRMSSSTLARLGRPYYCKATGVGSEGVPRYELQDVRLLLTATISRGRGCRWRGGRGC
jgi:hypothetical protein